MAHTTAPSTPAPVAPTPDPFPTRSSQGDPHDRKHGKSYLAILALGALGVVYGDIGTSPLYSVRESFHAGGILATQANVLGVISLVFWSLMIVVCIKYLYIVLRADHHGEGGILALTALVGETKVSTRREFALLTTLGLFGTALLYGDGIITPAISVLSAVEGIEFAVPATAVAACKPYIIPITVAILAGLFSMQARGTATVGRVFGPLMLIWFATLSSLGLYQLVQEPTILFALNPLYGLSFYWHNGFTGLMVLGSIFLVVTGGEALYADMGHFGRRPIQWAWFTVAFPSLILNYLGQGALLLRKPETISNPFYLMGPSWALPFVVLIATLATVIASQALISGVFSLATQSIQMGYLPRLKIVHTSPTERGQIYVPNINWLLMVACIGLVLGFETSSNMAAAYGVAVTATMVITTILLNFLLIYGWGWSALRAATVCGFFLLIEVTFLFANIIKIPQGGWFPLVVGGAIFILMTTWKEGRSLLSKMIRGGTVPLHEFLERLKTEQFLRVDGTAIFMYGNPKGTPPAMLANLRHNRALHKRAVILAVETANQPTLRSGDLVEVRTLQDGFYRVTLRFGYMDKPDVCSALQGLLLDGVPLEVDQVTFFLGRETVIPRRDTLSGMSYWKELLFAFMLRNATDATSFFGLPPDRVVELGTQLEI